MTQQKSLQRQVMGRVSHSRPCFNLPLSSVDEVLPSSLVRRTSRPSFEQAEARSNQLCARTAGDVSRLRTNYRLNVLLSGLFLMLLPVPTTPAEIIDRLVAVVNQQTITFGDVQREMKSQELDQSILDTGTNPSHQQKLTEEQATQRLIEQVLIYQQIQEFPGTEVSEKDVASQLAEIEKNAGGSEAWSRHLKNVGMSLGEVRQRVQWQLQVMKFIDRRFREFVVVNPAEIESYYRDQFLPDLQKRGIGEAPPLSEVEEKIRDILIEKKLNLQVEEWLASLRANATIQVFH
jgi:SurA-like N-terminal domain